MTANRIMLSHKAQLRLISLEIPHPNREHDSEEETLIRSLPNMPSHRLHAIMHASNSKENSTGNAQKQITLLSVQPS